MQRRGRGDTYCGVPVVAIGTCVIADPATASSGSGSISGGVTYNGALSGSIRTSLFPLGSNAPVARSRRPPSAFPGYLRGRIS